MTLVYYTVGLPGWLWNCGFAMCMGWLVRRWEQRASKVEVVVEVPIEAIGWAHPALCSLWPKS